jgi:hypothetical protein
MRLQSIRDEKVKPKPLRLSCLRVVGREVEVEKKISGKEI